MTIAIDYDGTFTLDPDLWHDFIRRVKLRGHVVICVTGRKPSQPVELPIPVVYAPDGYKRHAAEQHNYTVDVWIDNEPGFIEPTKVLEF